MPNLSTSSKPRYTTPPVIFGESSMIQSIQQILPRNLHLWLTLHNTVLERAQKILNGYLSEFLPRLIYFVELGWLFLLLKTALVITKYYFERSCLRLTKSFCLTKSIQVKNINFEVIYWFPEIYTCYGCHNTNFEKYIGFQKYIPLSDCKNVNFEEIHWFSEIYTSFGLQKYQFWRNTLISSNTYLFRMTTLINKTLLLFNQLLLQR